jgi:hypothetical protein
MYLHTPEIETMYSLIHHDETTNTKETVCYFVGANAKSDAMNVLNLLSFNDAYEVSPDEWWEVVEGKA